MRYQLQDGNTIIADETFMRAQYLRGEYTEVPDVVDEATQKRTDILAQLDAIDAATDKPRTRRELTLGNASTKAWLQEQDDAAAALRMKLAKL